MSKKLLKYINVINAIIDVSLILVALNIAVHLATSNDLSIIGVNYWYNPNLVSPYLFVLIPTIWLLVLIHLGSYNPEKNLRIVDEAYNLIVGAFFSGLIIASILFIIDSTFSRLTLLIFILITPILLMLPRVIYRLTFKKKIRQSSYQRILIAGAGEVGRRFAQEINDFSKVGYQLIGFVDDNPTLIESQSDVLGSIDQTAALIKEHHIDNLIIALPQWAYQRINALMQSVHTLPVRVWVIPDYFALMLSKSTVWNFVGIPMITLRSPTLNNRQIMIKRIFDLVICLPFFIITLPLYALISLFIKLDSPGPVLYRSIRIKENGETFQMLKFRTMIDNAHEHLTEVMKTDKKGILRHKRPDDPRVTRMGKILRRTSLDELPQLINIIKGDMSLVGPRPELPELVKNYQPWQYMRFAVPQGLTGWWQVNGRSDKPMHMHTDEDLYYIQHYSIWLDIQILIKTILVVLRGKGAY